MNNSCLHICSWPSRGFPGGSVVKNLPAIQETWFGRSLAEEMATHSSNLAWENPRDREPSGQPSMGLQRVRHNLATQNIKIRGSSCL